MADTVLARIRDMYNRMGDLMCSKRDSEETDRDGERQTWRDKVDEMHKILTEQQKKAESSSEQKAIKDFGDKLQKIAAAAEKMVSVADALKSEDPDQFIIAVISTISAFAVLAGPEGAIVAGVAQIACVFYKFLVMDWEPEESLPSKIRRIVKQEIHAALTSFKTDELIRLTRGWMEVGDRIQKELDLQIQGKAPYTGYKPERFDGIVKLQGEFTFEIGKKVRDEHEAAQCMFFTILYIKVSLLYYAMLMSHLRLAHQLDSAHVPSVQGDIDILKGKGKELLGFLSDKTLLGAAGMIDDCKRLKMIAYVDLRNSPKFDLIKNYRTVILDLSEATYTVDKARYSSVIWPIEWDEKCYEAHCRNNDHYFALVNHTKLPISIFSGEVGTKVKNLKFHEVVKPGECYTRMCTKGSLLTDFEAGGVFCLGSATDAYKNIGGAQLIQFAMFYHNPLLGSQICKIKTIVSDTPGEPLGQDALNNLEAASNNEECTSFWHDGKLFLLKAQADEMVEKQHLAIESEPVIRDHCIYRFCVTQTTVDELKIRRIGL